MSNSIHDNINVSVIIPVYNTSEYIARCAQSLFNQTIKEGIEFIFIDDASTDNSIAILESTLHSYPQRSHQVRIIRNAHNQGIAEVRNIGVENARGEYIIHCDSDDWVHREMYQQLLHQALANNADMVFCDYYEVYGNRLNYISQIANTTKELYLRETVTLKNFRAALWTRLIRRSLYNSLDFLWQKGVNVGEDISIIPRLVYYANTVSHIPKALYYYNSSNPDSYTHSNSPQTLRYIHLSTEIVARFLNEKEPDCFNDEINRMRNNTLYLIISKSTPDTYATWVEKYKTEYAIVYNGNDLGRLESRIYAAAFNGDTAAAERLKKLLPAMRKLRRIRNSLKKNTSAKVKTEN